MNLSVFAYNDLFEYFKKSDTDIVKISASHYAVRNKSNYLINNEPIVSEEPFIVIKLADVVHKIVKNNVCKFYLRFNKNLSPLEITLEQYNKLQNYPSYNIYMESDLVETKKYISKEDGAVKKYPAEMASKYFKPRVVTANDNINNT